MTPVLAVSVVVTLALGISACRSSSSNVVKLGPDTYHLSVESPPVRGGSVEAQRLALSEANDICAKNGKEAFVTEVITSKNTAEVKFHCVNGGVPKLQ